MKTILEIIFLDEVAKEFKLRIADPKEELEEMQVAAAAAEIVDSNIFVSNNTKLVRALSARIVQTTVETMEF